MKRLTVIILLATASAFLAFRFFSEEPAVKFLNSLNENQREKALFSFDDVSKTAWHYIPSSMFPRAGIPLKEIDSNQKELLNELLQSFLSETGYIKTQKIIDLENVLLEMSGDSVMRGPEKYLVAFYGNPKTDSLWAWSFEGHHISFNFTVHNGKATIAPRFLGANPATIPSGARKGERTLDREEDLGFQLINSLTEDQRKLAIFQEESLFEIVTKNAVEISPLSPVGIKFEELNQDQQAIFFNLLNEYLSTMPPEQAAKRMESIKNEEINEVRFGWAGATISGEGHYYRIQGKTFLVEFDNTQNKANHIHTVWRDFDGDFGRDAIREHYEHSNHHD
jgi:hypothetical protein